MDDLAALEATLETLADAGLMASVESSRLEDPTDGASTDDLRAALTARSDDSKSA